MTRRALLAVSFMVYGVLISQDVILMAQDGMTTNAKHITKAEILTGLDAGTATDGIAGGQAFQIVPDLVIRRRLEGSNDTSTHSTATDGRDVTEVLVITDGSATIMTGGEAREVEGGDVVVIPPGTPHRFTEVNGQVTMIEARLPISVPGQFLSKAEVMQGVAASNWGIGGQTNRIIPASEPTNANSLIVRHREKGRPNDASVHSTGTDQVNATEIMLVLDGSGTFVTNGNYVDTNPDYRSKDRTKGITGGVAYEVKAGDVVVYPPGTSHWYSNIDDQVTMIEVRIPGDVTGQ